MSERIESLISKEALAQFEQLGKLTDQNVAAFEKLVAKAIELNKQLGGATGFKEMNKAASDLAKTEDELAKKKTELQKQQEKLNDLFTIEAQKLAQLKAAQSEQNKTLKEQAQEALGLTDAYKKLEKEYAAAAKEAKNLAVTLGAQSKEAKEASARALELDARLKAADANVGRFNRNVGNYSGALKTLESALSDVSKNIDNYTKSGQQNEGVLQALTKEQQLLQSLVDAQSKGFANATGEIRNNQQAILLLSQVYGEDSAVVQELTSQTAKLSDTVSDMKATIKAQASDTKVFDGLIDAAQTLAGIYGAAQGAAALFGDENEDLQKTFVKLQAVLAVLAGLQGIQNALQKESAVRLLITNGLQKVNVAQKYLETAAESKNIIVKYAAVAAQKALNIATSAAGGPILLLIGLLAIAAASFAAYGDGAEDAAKQNERLNKALEESNQNIDKGSAAIKERGEKAIAQLEDQFASEEEIRKQREKNAQEDLENTKRINESDIRNREKNQRSIERLETLRTKKGKLSEDDAKALDDAIKIREGYLDNLQKQTVAENQIEILRLQNSRTTKEEIIKAKQEEIESQKTQLQTSLQLQQSIASNEHKTQSQRINALKEAAKLQAQIINSDANSKLLNPTLTPSQIKLIEAQRTAALTQARRESNKQIEDLNRSYAERDRKAQFDIIKLQIEDQIKGSDLIAANEAKSFDERTDALYDSYEKRRAIIIAQHDFDIANDTLTAKERTAIEQKYLSDINNLTIEYGLQQRDIYQQNQDKINSIIEKNQQGRLDKISTQQSQELIALEKSFREGKISVEDYEREKTKIEQRYKIISLKQEVDNATAKVLATKEGTSERFAAEKDLADKTLELNKALNEKLKAGAQELADLRKQAATEVFDTITSLNGSQFDRESQNIQDSIKNLDVQTQAEIDAINASTLSKEEKEKRIRLAEETSQQKKEQLERRQRQIDLERARFEKAANIAQIISTTALAIMEAYKTYKGTPYAFAIAGAIGAIGALQLARAIAAPLPKFAEGIDDAPGGLAWVGDAYKRELVITPQGQVMQTPSVPTVMNVPKHSIVLPDARAALEGGLAVNQHGRLVQNDNNTTLKIEQKLDIIAKAIKNKPVLNMNASEGGLTAMWQYGANWITYVEDQVNF